MKKNILLCFILNIFLTTCGQFSTAKKNNDVGTSDYPTNSRLPSDWDGKEDRVEDVSITGEGHIP